MGGAIPGQPSARIDADNDSLGGGFVAKALRAARARDGTTGGESDHQDHPNQQGRERLYQDTHRHFSSLLLGFLSGAFVTATLPVANVVRYALPSWASCARSATSAVTTR
jgi:hypothetical protein